MHAPFEITTGLEKLRAIVQEFPPASPHWNEAQNRFQFVDRLLTECLGWEKPNIRVEDADEAGGKADYVLGNPARAVVEAKREAKLWNTLPTGRPSAVRKLKPLLLASKELREAVHQILPYCAMRGAPIAIVCNGPQLTLFQALSIGEEPLDGECYFFNGFEDYINEFALLWTLLSPEGITENRALRDLALYRNPRMPPKASSFISEPNQHRYRNNLQRELADLASLLLEEIEDNPDLRQEFYKECYVPIEANNRHLLMSKQIINARYRRVSTDSTVPSSLDTATRTGQLGENYAAGAGARPIVVIGDVGVGKSSFFENLYLNMKENEKKSTYFIRIDLGIKANLTSGLKRYVLEAVPETLLQEYGVDITEASFVEAIYHKELRSFDRSIEGRLKNIDAAQYEKAKISFLREKTAKLDSHLLASIGHLARGRSKRVILVIDNADQRDFATQQEAFLIAQELAATRNLLVFVALRPSTFYVSKTTGTLAAYQNKLLTISPPPADEVVVRRLTFALRVAEGKAAPAALEGIRVNLDSIASFLRPMLRAVRNNEQIRQFLSNITGGNTRAVIELITSFCGSPNVDARKIVKIERETGRYDVPLHEFTKHALLGEYSYYNSYSSIVAANVYDTSTPDPREHFLACLIVGYLGSNLGIRDSDGFVMGHVIAKEMLRLGYSGEQTAVSLRRLASKRLIETPYLHYKEVPVPDSVNSADFHYRATSIGLYHVRYWAGSFAFLDAMSIDTPIFDEAVREAIVADAASFDIARRLRKATAFRDYLESRWHLANVEVGYFNLVTLLSSQGTTFETVRARTQPRQMRK
jgi:GTPase SAR1 family protein/predicted type IV restriction endonuclease